MLDIEYLTQLASSQEASTRIELAYQVGCCLVDDTADPAELALLIPIALQLADDTVVDVRRGLADALTYSPRAPLDVVYALIGDITEISEPLLTHCPALSDEELAAIVNIADETRLESIARRERLGTGATAALIEVAPEPVCALLLCNSGARISELSLKKLLERHCNSPRVTELLLRRDDISMGFRARLITLISERLGNIAQDRQWLSMPRARNVAQTACERSLLDLSRSAAPGEMRELVRYLDELDYLTASLVLRAACSGHLTFVAYALSRFSGMPVTRITALMKSRSGMGLNGICRRAGLGSEACTIISLALEAYTVLSGEGDQCDGERFGQNMIEGALTRVDRIGPSDQLNLLDLLADLLDGDSAALAVRLSEELRQAA